MERPTSVTLSSGGQLPLVGLGTFRARGPEVEAAVRSALKLGFRAVDTASIYKNEAEIAAALAAPGSPAARAEVFLTSKLSPYEMGAARVPAACDAILQRLGGPVDLVLIHWPGGAKLPSDSPEHRRLRRETWRVLEAYQRRGLFRAIGVSNYCARHLEELLAEAEVPPAVNQFECHPRWPQADLRALCAARGVAPVAYASLGSGALLAEPEVAAVAAEAGLTPAQALLLWGLQRGCAVIPKAVQEAHLAGVAPGVLLGRRLGEGALARLDGLCREPKKFCWDPEPVL